MLACRPIPFNLAMTGLLSVVEARFPHITLSIVSVHVLGRVKSLHVVLLEAVLFWHTPQSFEMTLKVRDGHVCGGGNQLKDSSLGVALISRTLAGGGKGAV